MSLALRHPNRFSFHRYFERVELEKDSKRYQNAKETKREAERHYMRKREGEKKQLTGKEKKEKKKKEKD